jgi:CRISPR-associated protein Csb3
MNDSIGIVRVQVDCTNPGQFFACCGILELAARLWHNVEAWFEDASFCVRGEASHGDPDLTITSLLQEVTKARLSVLEPVVSQN